MAVNENFLFHLVVLFLTLELKVASFLILNQK